MVCSVYYDYCDNDRHKRPRLDLALSLQLFYRAVSSSIRSDLCYQFRTVLLLHHLKSFHSFQPRETRLKRLLFISIELPAFRSLLLLYNTLDLVAALVAECGPSTCSMLIWHSANALYLAIYLLIPIVYMVEYCVLIPSLLSLPLSN